MIRKTAYCLTRLPVGRHLSPRHARTSRTQCRKRYSQRSFSGADYRRGFAQCFFRLYLIVRDAEGLVDSAFVDLQPNLSDFTINTQPQGLTIYVDGQPHIAPHAGDGRRGHVPQLRRALVARSRDHPLISSLAGIMAVRSHKRSVRR